MLERLRNAVLMMLALALGLRIAWLLVESLLPMLVVLAALLAIYRLLIRRQR